ncbi:MAG: hypothetical protein H6738_17600 [Alphaproteobacteria bacterium]|nr:hypothetical protein [Alphaproteobacteria bacterium]MCB9698600.1 hypothetical protein [Alphaproteobacteria bacterium]
MAFWDAWFAPKCEACGTKIVGAEPVLHQDKKLCEKCHAAALAAEAKRLAEVEARRIAEEEARQRLEDGKQFGVDPRSRQ